jgi:hypothetical protein
MIKQVRIEIQGDHSQKEKGDFLEDIFRTLMERQRYTVVQRIRFTGTEIDLLCQHRDRRDKALVECKARQTIVADDIKNFAYDLVVAKKAEHGYFVHTSELQQHAAGISDDLQQQYGSAVTFMGPSKLMELLQEAGMVIAPPDPRHPQIVATKLILLYTPRSKVWIYVFAMGAAPSHYAVCPADQGELRPSDAADALEFLKEELQDLQRVPLGSLAAAPAPRDVETVAEIQESVEWTDLRPVGAKYFVGRDHLNADLYGFVKAPIDEYQAPRVFFIEGKSGWGKSSVIAHLRARARNKRNRNTFFVFAVDSRSANTSAFVGMAVSQLLTSAADAGFIPKDLACAIRVPSWFDLLADTNFDELFTWLRKEKRILVLMFDQLKMFFAKRNCFVLFTN